MPREKRTFGWIQNPSSTESLKNVVALFVPESAFYQTFKDKRLPLIKETGLLASPDLYEQFLEAIGNARISYSLLKGKGAGSVGRKNAKCSGLAQAAIDGQQTHRYTINGHTIEIKKPYVDDWSADGFLRWAVSIGFLDYNYEDDTCSVTLLGRNFVLSKYKEDEIKILGTAYLSYPPACRVLELLSGGAALTKFEIGKQLGFTDEPGFTSFPQNIWVQAYVQGDDEERKNLIGNTEGSSDKYARMICGWLSKIGWVKKSPKKVKEYIGEEEYTTVINSAFIITIEGLRNYNRAVGKSSLAKVPKIVYLEMLASKASNADELRVRRAYIIKYISSSTRRSIPQIVEYLVEKGFKASESIVYDDINGLINIGLNIQCRDGLFGLCDDIKKLIIPTVVSPMEQRDLQSEIRERVRERLKYVNHKYLNLIDYSFQGKYNAEFEVSTIDLFTNELNFIGKHLGKSSKPDGIISQNERGVIIDNKAYSHGFSISRQMADEMIRYIQENNDRRAERNPNKWWENFPPNARDFSFLFISSLFKGEINRMLKGIKESTGVNGAVLNSENLLYFADAIKGGFISKEDFLEKLCHNIEVIYRQEGSNNIAENNERVTFNVHIDHVDTFQNQELHLS